MKSFQATRLAATYLMLLLLTLAASRLFADGSFEESENAIGPLHEDMIFVPGGSFTMGYEGSHADERPAHQVELNPFFIDRTEVTNARFAAFVEATGYVTQAERDGYAWGYLKGENDFRQIEGAQWRYPQGPDATLENWEDHPVVCVTWHDAQAYATWAGKRLPTEAEWEYASRAAGGGHQAAQLPEAEQGHHGHSGESVAPEPTAHHASGHASGSLPSFSESGDIQLVTANFWQGTWPAENRQTDTFFYSAPAGSFAPNERGVHDMIGNVWEWCADYYAADYYTHSPVANPEGPATGEHRIARGGSWFCSANYCGAYSTHYRGASPPTHAFNNVGFRCAVSASESSGGIALQGEQ